MFFKNIICIVKMSSKESLNGLIPVELRDKCQIDEKTIKLFKHTKVSEKSEIKIYTANFIPFSQKVPGMSS
jgi:hypothetical protein